MLDDNIKSFRINARGLLKIISIKMTSAGNLHLTRVQGAGAVRMETGLYGEIQQ